MSSPSSSPPKYESLSHSAPHIHLNSSKDNVLDQPTVYRSLTKGRNRRSSLDKRPIYKQQTPSICSSERLLTPGRASHRDPDLSRDWSPRSDASSKHSRSERVTWRPNMPNSLTNSMGPFASPFDDPSDTFNTQTASSKFNISLTHGLLLYPEDVEKDDWLHNPDSKDQDEYGWHFCSLRGFANCIGLVLVVFGLIILLVGYPLLSFVQEALRKSDTVSQLCAQDPMCISANRIPLLKNSRTGLIDPDTPKSALTKKSFDGRAMNLVFSDEFNKDGRTFYDGDDPYWQAVDIWYGVTADLEWYDPDAIWTQNGTLNIRFDAFQNHNLNYRSGMLQSWNKLCFKGGRLEASISLPGSGDTIGFWPGFWAMGNLGRPGYAATTDGMWPYSYDDICDAGITPNQSDPSGLNHLPGMRLPACTCIGEDHPSPGVSRSAPEIDVIEASVLYLDPPSGAAIGSASQSIQVAPFDVFWRPDYDFVEVYDHSLTTMNDYQGSVYQQAVSGVTNLNNTWYNGKNYQSYAFEYEPGPHGKVTWFVGDTATWTVDAMSLRQNGNVGQRIIPMEPMAIVVNFGMSNGFAALNMTGLSALMPAIMKIDYVRIYQHEDDMSVTCDPPGYETTEYITKHPEPYNNPNITRWEQSGYKWPMNSLMHECE